MAEPYEILPYPWWIALGPLLCRWPLSASFSQGYAACLLVRFWPLASFHSVLLELRPLAILASHCPVYLSHCPVCLSHCSVCLTALSVYLTALPISLTSLSISLPRLSHCIFNFKSPLFPGFFSSVQNKVCLLLSWSSRSSVTSRQLLFLSLTQEVPIFNQF